MVAFYPFLRSTVCIQLNRFFVFVIFSANKGCYLNEIYFTASIMDTPCRSVAIQTGNFLTNILYLHRHQCDEVVATFFVILYKLFVGSQQSFVHNCVCFNLELVHSMTASEDGSPSLSSFLTHLANTIEPCHEKTYFSRIRTTKAQISL